MDFEGIVPSEISQTGKDKHCMVLLTCRIFQKANFMESESGIVVAGTGGGGKWDVDQRAQTFSF